MCLQYQRQLPRGEEREESVQSVLGVRRHEESGDIEEMQSRFLWGLRLLGLGRAAHWLLQEARAHPRTRHAFAILELLEAAPLEVLESASLESASLEVAIPCRVLDRRSEGAHHALHR